MNQSSHALDRRQIIFLCPFSRCWTLPIKACVLCPQDYFWAIARGGSFSPADVCSLLYGSSFVKQRVPPEITLNKMVLRQTDQPVWPGPAYIPKVGPAPTAGHRLNIDRNRPLMWFCRLRTASTAITRARPSWCRKGMPSSSPALWENQSRYPPLSISLKTHHSSRRIKRMQSQRST